MKRPTVFAVTSAACLVPTLVTARPRSAPASPSSWNSRAAAADLDGRLDRWLSRPHALARPALRGALAARADRAVPAPERKRLERVHHQAAATAYAVPSLTTAR